MDLSDLIERNAAFAPDKIALRFAGTSLTYADLAARIATAARALKSGLGIGRGDRVAILAANHPDYLVLLYACARLGAMLVPLNWRLAVPEQVFILTDASVKALVVEEAFAAVVPPLTAAQPDARIIGLDFTPPGGMSFAALLDAASGDGHIVAAARGLHLRHDRAAEGRGAAPGGARLERRNEPAHA
jgi:fatty-acyl-CoA synthase